MKQSQRGSTLIVVLVMLLLITIAGAMAIRQSVSSLKMVTNGQVQAVLLRSSDAALTQIQSANLSNTSSTNGLMNNLGSSGGVIGFLRNPSNYGQELVFCFKSSDPFFFNMANATIVTSTTSYDYGNNGGICQDGQYSNGRSAVYTQVAIKNAGVSPTPFSELVRGTDVNTSKTENSVRLRVFVTSYLPAFSGLTSVANITDGSGVNCFRKLNDTTSGDVTSCLASLSVPYNTQVAEMRFQAGFN